MAEHNSIWEALGFRKASGLGEAGWGYTLIVAIVSFIYFIPVLMIIFTAFKPSAQALSVPPTLSPTSLFGLIPDHFVFTPTLENFGQVFNRVMVSGNAAEPTGFDVFFFNSFFISSVSVLLALVIGTLASYGFSRYPLKGNDTYLFNTDSALGADTLNDSAGIDTLDFSGTTGLAVAVNLGLATAQIVNTVPWIDAKLYASTQVVDEARHVEVYERYLREKVEMMWLTMPKPGRIRM